MIACCVDENPRHFNFPLTFSHRLSPSPIAAAPDRHCLSPITDHCCPSSFFRRLPPPNRCFLIVSPPSPIAVPQFLSPAAAAPRSLLPVGTPPSPPSLIATAKPPQIVASGGFSSKSSLFSRWCKEIDHGKLEEVIFLNPTSGIMYSAKGKPWFELSMPFVMISYFVV
ncbi:hypothetical protein HHK36_002666 [Tetracentron sinense]|uniref:Uncharacterized protein n=1 Tax=Tetracentron sinense TaxID=13715 RepID=A0A834ZLW9_TETSI|nr:hypothetical protein HHK36_002666 [Tetracentron sinense]